MKLVRFLLEARDEFLEQISYYEEQQKGLGDRFRESVEAATALASAHPKLALDMQTSAQTVADVRPALEIPPFFSQAPLQYRLSRQYAAIAYFDLISRSPMFQPASTRAQ